MSREDLDVFVVDDVRSSRIAEISVWIKTDREHLAKGTYVLRQWMDSLVARGTCIRRIPVKLPAMVVRYLCTVHTFLVGEFVMIGDDGSVRTVLSPRKQRPIRTGLTLLEAIPA